MSARPASAAVRGGASALLLLVVALSSGGCSAPESVPADEWRGFRGPNGLGLSAARDLPSAWSVPGPAVRWRAPVPGRGNSQPSVAGGRVFLTTSYEVEPASELSRDDDTPEDEPQGGPSISLEASSALYWRVALAYDMATGNLLWQRELFKAPAEKRAPLNTLAGPTPATDGDSVFVYFGSVLAALDRDGTVLWQKEIDPTYAETSRYGAASSPVLTSRDVVVMQDKEYGKTEDVGYLAAFDRETGDERWRTDWEDTCCAYSTPLVVETETGQEIWVTHSGRLVAYSAASGVELWRHEVPINQTVSGAVYQPLEEDKLVVIAGGADRRRASVGLRLTGSGKGASTEQLWLDERMAPQASSPILHDGLLYVLTLQGVLVCRDALTGEVIWRGRLSRPRNHASLVAGDGKIYAVSSGGRVSVVAMGRAFEILAENDLDERGTTASPALAAGCFLQRGERNLFCLGDVPESAPAGG